MPRPKGCTCGTPKPCKIHADGVSDPGADATGPALSVIPGDGAAPDPAPDQLSGLFGIAGGQPAAEPKPKPKRRRADPKPKPRESKPRKPIAPTAPDDAALVQMLSEFLTMPAIPAAVVFHCEYCRDHFISEGPKAARELVALSIVNPALRGALESLHSGWSKITIFGVLAGYMAKPMMHHLAPEPVLAAAGPVLGVPPRPPKPKAHRHAESEPSEYEGDEADEAEHFGEAAEDFAPGYSDPGIHAA